MISAAGAMTSYLSQSSQRAQSFLIRFPEGGNLIKRLIRFVGKITLCGLCVFAVRPL